MKQVANFTITVSQVGDQFLAEIVHIQSQEPTVVLSSNIRANPAMTEDGVRHFAFKNFCLEIGDELRAHLERLPLT